GAGDAEESRVDLDAGHELGFFLGLLDGRGRRVEVDDDALAQAARVGRADADDLDLALLGDLPMTATTFRVPISNPTM
ncbi:MAG: hypothetical protein NT147_04520, partial [Candidatus Aminicenantes bacterium]|nr:hypothetical protein [Candidatus Aminicenantes bacterium]